MFRSRTLFTACALAVLGAISSAASGQVVISQIFGGAGSTGNTYSNDYIELFNRGPVAVNLSTWSVQYASTTGASWTKTNLTGSIPAGGYYLIQAIAGTATTPLPTPDATGTLSLSTTGGKVALVANQTALGAFSYFAPGVSGVVDFVAYGVNTTAIYGFEGNGPTGTNLSATTAAYRLDGGCTDTNNNAADFTTGAPLPRNSFSSTTSCTGFTPSGACCLSNGSCAYVTASACAANTGATYTGDYVACAPGSYTVTNTSAPLIDISATGTNITGTGGDNFITPALSSAALALPFPVTYFGQNFNHFRVDSNGWMTLCQSFATSIQTNSTFPSSTSTVCTLAPYWDDLTTAATSTGRIYSQTNGAMPNRQFIVQWNTIPWFSPTASVAGTSKNTFQVIFNEATQVIEFRYGSIVANGANYAGGTAVASFNAGFKDLGGANSFNIVPADLGTGGDAAARQFIPTGQCPITGACCADGVCTIRASAFCLAYGGDFGGNGSVCSAMFCNSGACCADLGGCTVSDRASCATNWIPGQTCGVNPCPQPNGSCCNNATGVCTLTYNGTCSSGSSLGIGSTCDGAACPATAVCCITASGSCSPIYGGTCTTGSAGTGTVCDASACTSFTGGCCVSAGTCTSMFAADCTTVAGTFLGTGVMCAPSGMCFAETEPNSAKSAPNSVTLASGDRIAGTTTGTTVGATSAVLTSADYWLITTPAAPLGIYRHEMTFSASGTVAQTISQRGLSQTVAGTIQAGTDNVIGSTVVAPRTTAWYGFGKQEQIVYAVTGTGTSTGGYTLTMTDTPVTPLVAAGTLNAGSITLRTVRTVGTATKFDFWLYDSAFNPLVHDVPSGSGPAGSHSLLVTTGNPTDTLCSMLRTLPAGTYYMAVSGSNLANDQPSWPTDDAGQQVMDFPNGVTTSGNNGPQWEGFAQLVDSVGNTVNSPTFVFQATWYNVVHFIRFTVVEASTGECCMGASCTVTLQGDCSGGIWTPGGACMPGPCSLPTGTCCVLGNCSISTQATCASNSGAWDGMGTVCGSETCPTQCCTQGACTFVIQSACTSGGGTFNVGGAACEPSNPCPQAVGICCDNVSGACTLRFSGSCASGTNSGTGNTCSAGTPSSSCPVLKICCASLTGECTVRYNVGGACPANNATGTGTTCSPGTPSSSCPATKICCDTASGACTVVYSTTVCAGVGTGVTGTGTTCSPGTPSTSCPASFCCANATGACTIRYSAACATGTTTSSSGTCSAGAPSDSCTAIAICCNTSTGLCTTLYGSTCASAGLGSTGTGLTCGPTSCDFVKGACCQQGGVCTQMFSAACAAITLPDTTPAAGTFLAAGSACPGTQCFGEHEPNSDVFGMYVNNPATLSHGDTITGIATGGNFDTAGNAYPNGSQSNPFVDMWLVGTAPTTLGIYRHELTMIQGSAGQGYGLRGLGQTGGAPTSGNLPLQGSSGAAKLTAWYGFGKGEKVIVEPFGGSTTPYVLKLADTPVTPTIATGALAPGAVTIRIVNTGTNVIDSDVWIYDGSFNALVNSVDGPGGADGVLASGDPPGTTTSFTRTLPAGTYYLAVSPANLANDQPNDPIEGISATTGTDTRFITYHADVVLCTKMNQTTDYTCHVELADAATGSVISPDITWPATTWNGEVRFVQFTVGAAANQMCCRGTTCVGVASGTCTGTLGNSASLVVGTCGPHHQISHCCYADYDHSGISTIDDLFIYINTWLIASPYTKIDGNASAAPSIDDLFIFINLWLVGCQP